MTNAPDPTTTSTALNVAVLVHNDVVRDARVLKEVETLGRAGFIVDVVGASVNDSPHPSTVPGARSLRIVNIAQLGIARATGRVERLLQFAFDYAVFVVPLSVIFLLISTSSGSLTDLALGIVFSSPIFYLSIKALPTNSPDRRAMVKQLSTYGLLALAVAMAYGIATYELGVLSAIAISSILWLIARKAGDLRSRYVNFIARLRQRFLPSYRKQRYQEIARRLSAAVEPTKFDAVHCHDIIALIAGADLKKRHPHLRLIWDAHEFYEELASGTEEDRKLIREIIRSAAPRVDAFVTISESFRDIYAELYPKLPSAHVVMNATRPIDEFDYDGRLHKAAGLDPGRRILLFQGGLSPHRGIDQLLDAAGSMPEPWSIVMMGWGKLEEAISDRIKSLVDPDRPEVAPLALIPAAPQEELPYWSAGATLGAIPYENIGQNHLYCTPNKLWEYPNAGVPVLVSGLVEMTKIVSEWDIGIILPREFTAADIVDALESTTPAALLRTKANCKVFSERMSWSHFEPALLAAYDGLAPNRRFG